MVKRPMKIVFRDDDLNHDFDLKNFEYYEEIKHLVKVSLFCVPKIDFDWSNYLSVCEEIGPGSDPIYIRNKMKWYPRSLQITDNKILYDYLSKNIRNGWMHLGLHGSKHYQISNEEVLPKNYSFGAEYLLSDFDTYTIKEDLDILQNIDSDIQWFSPPQNLISVKNFKKLTNMGLNISCDLKVLKNPEILVGLRIKSIFNILKWKLVHRIRFYYPFAMIYKDVKVLGVLRLNTKTDVQELFRKICHLQEMGGEVVVINTHLSAFNLLCENNLTLGQNLVCLVNMLSESGKFEFVTIKDV